MAIESIYPSQLSVLLIEDGLLFRKSLEEYLHLEGFSVTAVSNAQESYRFALRMPFDVILTDAVFPGPLQVDDLLRRLRTNSANHLTPVVFMTAWPRFTNGQAAAVLEKPFDLIHLARTLRRVVGNS